MADPHPLSTAEEELERAERLLMKLQRENEQLRAIIDLLTGDAGPRPSKGDLEAMLQPPTECVVSRMGGVYFAAGLDLVKIGYSAMVENRIQTMSQGSPRPLVLLGWIPYQTTADCERGEAAAHEAFQAVRERGEWFRLTHAEAVAYLRAHSGIILESR